MSRSLRSTVATLVAATLIPAAVAVTPAAAAPAAAPSMAGVAEHVQAATKAAKRVTKYARRGNDRAAARFLVQARRQAVTGAREARALAGRAGASDGAADQAVLGLAAAAATYGNATQSFAGLLDTTSGPLQTALAKAIPGSVAGRTQLLGMLSGLMTQLDGPQRDRAALGLAAVQAGAPAQVAGLAQATTLAALPASLQAILDTALAAATAALDDGLAQVTALLPTLPPGAQAQVAQALGLVSSTLAAITPLLAQTTQLVTSTLNSVLGLVSGLIPQVTAITGVVPGAGAPGATPAAGTPLAGLQGLIPDLGGLLGGLGGLIPGLGGLLGGR